MPPPLNNQLSGGVHRLVHDTWILEGNGSSNKLRRNINVVLVNHNDEKKPSKL